ncbi:hypothetical protein [Streptomyces cyaneofuscatus]|uniref:hypothetical protein n=1 Tax=Streptomyces cyaneofuscatus TaxID=66883 RepID=UPI00379FF830|nr:hypothetical protein OG973_36380 [Streptomyces cyaneofuscatus]
MTATLPTRPSATGTCPNCEGNFETCRCGIRPGLTDHRARLAPVAGGGWGGMEDDDNRRGYERDETDTSYNQLVGRLVADGDRRAATAGRRARRTLAEMAPGQTRQPLLRMTRQLTFAPTAAKAGADDACVLCGWWKCRCGGAAPAPTQSVLAVAS